MKRVSGLILAVTLGMFIVAGQGYAQGTPSNLKIAYVELSRIFDEFSKTKEYDAVLEKKQVEFETEHKNRLQKIKDSEGKLALMKEDEKIKLQNQIDKDKADLMAYDRQLQTDLRKERDEKIREILGDIEKVIKDFAEKEGYTLILNDRVLIYGADSFNITPQIIKILTEKSPAKK